MCTEGATGVNVLKLICVPSVFPYVRLGLYSAAKGMAVAGEVRDHVLIGVGYNTVRGVNEQRDLRF